MKNKIILIFTIAILIINLNFVLSQDIIWSGETPVDFTIVNSYPSCDLDRLIWRVWDKDSQIITEQPSANDCFRNYVETSDYRRSTTCCPSTNICDLDNPDINGKFSCQGGPAPAYCSDYSTENYGVNAKNYCNGFQQEVANRTVNEFEDEVGFCGSTQRKFITGEGTCSFVVSSCRCVWDDTSGECMQAYSESDLTCPNGPVANDGDCVLKTTNIENKCESDGKILYEWIADWTRTDGTIAEDLTGKCDDDSRDVPCVSTAMLTFFTTLSLIIAILLLIIFYSIIIRKKRKYKGKKSRKKKL